MDHPVSTEPDRDPESSVLAAPPGGTGRAGLAYRMNARAGSRGWPGRPSESRCLLRRPPGEEEASRKGHPSNHQLSAGGDLEVGTEPSEERMTPLVSTKKLRFPETPGVVGSATTSQFLPSLQ